MQTRAGRTTQSSSLSPNSEGILGQSDDHGEIILSAHLPIRMMPIASFNWTDFGHDDILLLRTCCVGLVAGKRKSVTVTGDVKFA